MATSLVVLNGVTPVSQENRYEGSSSDLGITDARALETDMAGGRNEGGGGRESGEGESG